MRVEPGAAVGGDAGWVVRLVGWLGLVGGRAVTSCWRLERGRVGGGWDGWRSGRCNRRVGLAEQVARGMRVCVYGVNIFDQKKVPAMLNIFLKENARHFTLKCNFFFQIYMPHTHTHVHPWRLAQPNLHGDYICPIPSHPNLHPPSPAPLTNYQQCNQFALHGIFAKLSLASQVITCSILVS